MMSTKDIIDTLAGIEPGSALDAIRAKRVQARDNAQKSYLSLVEAINAEIARGKTSGPYGAYPAGPLSVENTAGLIYRVSVERKSALGARLVVALEHAHLLVFRPRDAASTDMKALLAAGWSNTGIVTLSQLVAFLSFQVRVVSGLRTLAAANA